MTIFDEAKRWLRSLKQAEQTHLTLIESLNELDAGYRLPFIDESDPYIAGIREKYGDSFYHARVHSGPLSLALRNLVELSYDHVQGLPENDPNGHFLPRKLRFDKDSEEFTVTAISREEAMAAIDTAIKNIVVLPIHIKEECNIVRDSTGQEYYQWAMNGETPSGYGIRHLLDDVFAPEKDGDVARHNANYSTGHLDRKGNFVPQEDMIFANSTIEDIKKIADELRKEKNKGLLAIRVKKTPETSRIMRDVLGIDPDKGPDAQKGGRAGR